MRELDPELWEWLQARRRHRMYAVPVLIFGAALLVATLAMVLSRGGPTP